MAKYRKRPVVIEAWQWTTGADYSTAPQWAQAVVSHWSPTHIQVTGNQGVVQADPGDWLIKGVEGEVYPCKPSVFDATYEPVEEETPVLAAKPGKFLRITSGRSYSTGSVASGWTTHFVGDAPSQFEKLSDAKKLAVERGASGRWKSRRYNNGRRTTTEYTDLADGA